MIMRFLGYFRRRAFASRTHFFPIFSRQAAYIRQASTALTAMMKTSDQSEWRRLEKEVKMCEVQGDAMLAEFYGELYENIVTPVDRDHLQTIAMYIDEFLDNINVSAKSILLYLPDRIDTGLLELAQYIESEADALKEIIAMLMDIRHCFSSITLQCDRISELEHAADDSYEEYIEKHPNVDYEKYYQTVCENAPQETVYYDFCPRDGTQEVWYEEKCKLVENSFWGIRSYMNSLLFLGTAEDQWLLMKRPRETFGEGGNYFLWNPKTREAEVFRETSVSSDGPMSTGYGEVMDIMYSDREILWMDTEEKDGKRRKKIQ